MKAIFLLMTLLCSFACQTGVIPIAQRKPLQVKEGDAPSKLVGKSDSKHTDLGNEVFIKNENHSIVPKEQKNYTGSLFSLKRKEGFLYTPRPRGLVGETIDVKVDVNRSGEKSSGQTGEAANPSADKSKDELLSALPNLEPGDNKAKIPDMIKMKVVREMENGDVILEVARSSSNEVEANSIKAQARLSADAKNSGKQIKTSDLSDVNWIETNNGVFTQRESSIWEDEYTLRWAGFDEARSKNAVELENKRKDLEKVKNRLEDRIINLGKERESLSKEKDKTEKMKIETEQKLKELNKKIDDQNLLVEQQKEALKKQEELINSLKKAPKDAPK